MCAARSKKSSGRRPARPKAKTRSLARASAAASADGLQQHVVDTAVELSDALHRQSTDTSTWNADEVALWRDERRETTALIQVLTAPGSHLPSASAASCNASIAANNAATTAVTAAADRDSMLAAIVLTNQAQRLLAGLA